MSELQPDWAIMETSVEGLFVRAYGARITASSACLAELRAVGIDPTLKLKPSYPAHVYERGTMVLRRHLLAAEPDDERALWAMGRETTSGFYRTAIGTALGAVLKLLSPDRMLPRLPKNIVSSSNFMKATIEQRGPKHFELYVFGSRQPSFLCGAVERAVEQTGVKPKLSIKRSEGLEAWVDITW